MDGLTLLNRAHAAGLDVAADGDRLVIRGPRSAEAVARLLIEHKPEVLAALIPAGQNVVADHPAWWRDRYATRIAHWFHSGRRWHEAELVAFSEVMLEWHRRRGTRADPRRCAGCGDELSSYVGLLVDREGVRVHFDAVRRVDCIIAYGQKWRGAAAAGLVALGLDPPSGFEPL